MKSFFKRCFFVEIFVIISSIFAMIIFSPIYKAKSVIIPYAIHSFDICVQYPNWWRNIKILFIIFYIIANIIIFNYIYNFIENKFGKKTEKSKKIEQNIPANKLVMYVGKNEENQLIYIPENGLYQNILVTRNNWNWKNQFMYVSFYKTINSISKSKLRRENRNVSIRCKRELL